MNINYLLEKIIKLTLGQKIFIAGGPVRDWLLERSVMDIDLVIDSMAIELARSFANKTGGTFVLLNEKEDVARVIIDNFSFDFSIFRKAATTIVEDLSHRDFTINAMAIPVKEVMHHIRLTENGLSMNKAELFKKLIDPFCGRPDLYNRIIKSVSVENLIDDPLRMLRAFRFKAVLDFSIEPHTLDFIYKNSKLILMASPERINYELTKIMKSSKAGCVAKDLYDAGLLSAIIPEIKELRGIEQPGFHHLDCLEHCLATVNTMDRLIKDPCIKFSSCNVIKKWLISNKKKIPWLKWAALLHDFGKPQQKNIKKNGRVTFYNHDKKGAEIVKGVASRLRWSKDQASFVYLLVRMHMRPFHLLNDLRKQGPSRRALRRLLEKTGTEYPALFLLAMADSMAGCGPMKPKELDHEISLLFNRVHGFYLKRLKPVKKCPPLLTGKDVMNIFSLRPGPMVGKALKAVEALRIEGIVRSKDEAISWLKEHFPNDLSVS